MAIFQESINDKEPNIHLKVNDVEGALEVGVSDEGGNPCVHDPPE